MALLIRAVLVLFLTWQGLSTLMSKGMNLNFLMTRGPLMFPDWLPMGWAGLQLLLAIWLLTPRYRQALWPLLLVLAAPMLALFCYPVWMQSSGGFPAIGAGQTLIKQLAVCALPLWLLGYRQQSKWLGMAGLALVFVWLGAMNFTQAQATDLAMLVQSSPLTRWLDTLLGSKGVAALAGVWDLLAAALFLIPASRLWGALAISLALLIKLHFLATFDDALMYCWLTATGADLLKSTLLLVVAWLWVGSVDHTETLKLRN